MKINRRDFMKKSAVASPLAALISGLPGGWTGTAYASDAPETKQVRFGIIALTDCSSIVMAHELGYFKLIGMPFASTIGLLGSPVKPMVIPWMLNRNGQAITLANKFKGKVKTARDMK